LFLYGVLDFITILAIIVIFIGSRIIPGPREWWASISRRPMMAVLIVLSLVSVFLGQPRGMQSIAENPVDTIRLARILLLGILAATSIVAICLTRNRRAPSGWGIIGMAAYALLAMGSCVYSNAPILTLWKGFEVLAITLVVMLIAVMMKDADDIQHVLNIIYIALSYLIISSLGAAIFNPSEAFTTMAVKGPMAFSLQGIYPFVNANTLSQVSAIVSAIALTWMVRSDRNYSAIGPFIVFLASFACLILSHSRTSIVALLLATFLILFVYRRIMMLLSLFWITTLFALSGMIINYVTPYIMRGQKMAVFATLTGRLEFWPEVLKKIWEAPILGHGFYASQRVMWNISSVDNTYLEVVLGIGIVGLFILCIPLLSIIANLWNTRPWKNKISLNSSIRFLWVQLASIFIILFIRSFTGPSFQNLHINLILFAILIIGAYRLRTITNSILLGDQGQVPIRSAKGINNVNNAEPASSKGLLHAGTT